MHFLCDYFLIESVHMTGCKCSQGYYRSFDGRCVNELTCTFCGYNEDWYEPIQFNSDDQPPYLYCPEDIKCDDVDGPADSNEETTTTNETRSCEVGYCHCTEGTFRTDTGHCVNDSSCRYCPGPNEVYEECGSSSCWEFTCDQSQWTLQQKQYRACTLDCRSGCKCQLGYYRNQADICVSSSQCSP